ncbi:MAG: hypothetical protein E7428_11055 [Ruminococcaceae bacterium]|nr:hypothetical protein [Oscillospiraceae bacterium]
MENTLRKQELTAILSRNGVMLDEGYILRAKELYNAAASSAYEAEQVPFVTEEEAEEDMDAAYDARPRDTTLIRILFLSCFALGLLSLLLPLQPFLARSPICGGFLGLGGILLFAYLLGAKKREKRAETYQALLAKYGVENLDDMEEATEANRRVHQTAADSMNALRNFVHFADPEANTPGECASAIRYYDALIKEYNSL